MSIFVITMMHLSRDGFSSISGEIHHSQWKTSIRIINLSQFSKTLYHPRTVVLFVFPALTLLHTFYSTKKGKNILERVKRG